MRHLWATVHAHLQELSYVANQDMADVLLSIVVPHTAGVMTSPKMGK